MSQLAEIGNMPEILRLCALIKTLPQVDCPLEHYYLPGVCFRVMRLKAGTSLTGKIHKHEHIAVLLEGTLRLADDEHAFIITAPWVGMGKAGVKRLGYAETDCVFANILSTDITDPDELEREMVVDTFDEFEQFLLENDREIPKQLP
jgi:hypothetical protein